MERARAGKLLGYTVWRNFAEVIAEAQEVCRTTGGDVARNFAATIKVSGKRGPAQQDYRLTRHACYLIAESADGRKPQVALAKMYFALTTERHELLAGTEEDRARIEERRILARENAELGLRAHAAGVLTGQQFAAFFNAGYRGLYQETVAQIRAQGVEAQPGRERLDGQPRAFRQPLPRGPRPAPDGGAHRRGCAKRQCHAPPGRCLDSRVPALAGGDARGLA
ncbi:MAG: hypothetical protein IVW57_07590 [Ktedonobacterales bacterium]|nr:hypothetical protein [Ktedonobacterales bacterium]